MNIATVSPYDAGLEGLRAGCLADAERGFRQALEDNPLHTAALYHLGLALHESERSQEAILLYWEVLRGHPDNLHAWINLGDLYGKAGRASDAISAWERALQLDAESVLVLNNMGVTCSNLGRAHDAAGYFRRAASIEPDRHDLWFSLGNCLLGLGRHTQAEKALRQALRIDTTHAQTHNNLGVTLGHLKRDDEAIGALRQALECDADLADGLNNLALALYKRDARDEALRLLRHCVDRHPGYALGWANLGMVLQGMGQLEEAVRVIDRALELTPNQEGWLWNQSLAYLTMGDFERGWQHFETRYAPGRADPVATLPDLPFPMWTGEDLSGKRILLVKEQGFGDQIQCLRFVANLVARGASVGVWVHSAVAPLAALVPGVQEVMTDPPAEGYDYWALLMSLPVRFAASSTTLPQSVPYVAADPAQQESMHQRIEAFAAGRLKVGINWAGNPSHPNDRNRSLGLADIAAWLDLSTVAWVSLQTQRSADTNPWVQRGNLLPLGDEIQNFADTAAIIANLDVVISIDSAVAHLAGAMGARTWLLLPANPDYRWMLERTDSPWYPTMQLWRQATLGDWHSTLGQVEQALRLETGETGVGIAAPGFARCMPLAGPQRLMSGRHGWFVYNHHDQYVGQALEHYGEYGEHEVQWFGRILQGFADCDVIEVGANIGSQTVALCRMARRVFALEPQPTVFQTLCANVALNAIRNCQAYPMAAGEVAGTLKVPPVGYDRSGNFGGISLQADGAGTPVQVVALDEFLAKLVPDLRVRLIKVDVEGMERAVLRGARQLIARDRPLLYVENDRIEQSEALILCMREMGYRLYWHCPLLFNSQNFFGNADNIYQGIAAFNMLGVPQELEFETLGMTEVGEAHEHILQRG
jgi:FkbM family methyltransferase